MKVDRIGYTRAWQISTAGRKHARPARPREDPPPKDYRIWLHSPNEIRSASKIPVPMVGPVLSL